VVRHRAPPLLGVARLSAGSGRSRSDHKIRPRYDRYHRAPDNEGRVLPPSTHRMRGCR
jgi:hypothetical protein